MKNIERRVVAATKLVTRAAKDDNTAGTLFGMPIVANSRSQFIGGFFYEVISPEAIRNALARAKNIALLHSHDDGRVVATTQAGTMSTWFDERLKAARFRAEVSNTTDGRDLLVSVERGDIRGMSFAFRCPDGGDSWSLLPDGSPLRTISKMIVHEYSAVLEGAYEKPVISTKEDLRSVLRNAPGDIRDLILRDNDQQDDDNLDVVHDDDACGGAPQDMRCLRCQTDVIGSAGDDADGIDADGGRDADDNEVASLRCACSDESLRQWVCSRCNGLVRSVDVDEDEDASDTEDGYNERAKLAAVLLLRAASA